MEEPAESSALVTWFPTLCASGFLALYILFCGVFVCLFFNLRNTGKQSSPSTGSLPSKGWDWIGAKQRGENTIQGSHVGISNLSTQAVTAASQDPREQEVWSLEPVSNPGALTWVSGALNATP